MLHAFGEGVADDTDVIPLLEYELGLSVSGGDGDEESEERGKMLGHERFSVGGSENAFVVSFIQEGKMKLKCFLPNTGNRRWIPLNRGVMSKKLSESLRKVALALPDTEEGIACKGTKLECPTVTVRNKAFLFLSENHLRLKLGDSLTEASEFACCKIGAGGWVQVMFDADKLPSAKTLERWIKESYQLAAPKKKSK
jgi:hypothetical protein